MLFKLFFENGSKACFTGFWYEVDGWGSPHLWAPVVGLKNVTCSLTGTSLVHYGTIICNPAIQHYWYCIISLQPCFFSTISPIYNAGLLFHSFSSHTQELPTRPYPLYGGRYICPSTGTWQVKLTLSRGNFIVISSRLSWYSFSAYNFRIITKIVSIVARHGHGIVVMHQFLIPIWI